MGGSILYYIGETDVHNQRKGRRILKKAAETFTGITWISCWSQAGRTTFAPLQTGQKKPSSYHHCKIIQRYYLLTFDSFVSLEDVSLVTFHLYKVINGLAPPLQKSSYH